MMTLPLSWIVRVLRVRQVQVVVVVAVILGGAIHWHNGKVRAAYERGGEDERAATALAVAERVAQAVQFARTAERTEHARIAAQHIARERKFSGVIGNEHADKCDGACADRVLYILRND